MNYASGIKDINVLHLLQRLTAKKNRSNKPKEKSHNSNTAISSVTNLLPSPLHLSPKTSTTSAPNVHHTTGPCVDTCTSKFLNLRTDLMNHAGRVLQLREKHHHMNSKATNLKTSKTIRKSPRPRTNTRNKNSTNLIASCTTPFKSKPKPLQRTLLPQKLVNYQPPHFNFTSKATKEDENRTIAE
ncbi:hypothetical protein M758_4G247200 [Ceratodon purpureus]|nr:hypothetical protein M758_4G247200 [Ceratodon purpureus]